MSNSGFTPAEIKANRAEQATIEDRLRQALSSYTQEDVNRLARTGKLPDQVTQELHKYASKTSQANPIGTVLDYISRPGQAVLAGLGERHGNQVFNPEAAVGGLAHGYDLTPIQAVQKGVTQGTTNEARKFEKGIPAIPRFAGNVALGTVTDPLTYVSFGTTAGSKAAVDTAAELTAASRVAEAAKAGQALNYADQVATLRTALRSIGKKALTRDEFKALGSKVKRGLRGAPGGVKVAGKTVIPGRAFENDALAGLRTKLLNSRPVAAVEDMGRTLPGLRQAERAGDVAAGTTERVAQAFRRAESARTITSEDWLRLSKAGMKIPTESRAKLVAALEDPSLVPTLDKAESRAFDALAQIRKEKTDLLVNAGRLRSDASRLGEKVAAQSSASADARQVISDWAARAAQGDKEAAAQLAKPANQILDDALAEASKAPPGAFVGETTPMMTTERYFPRVASQESQQAGTVAGSPVSLGPSSPKYLKAREAETRFAPTPSLIDPKTGLPRFETDPFVATYKHAAAVNADTARVQFIQDMRHIQGPGGKPLVDVIDNLPEEEQRLVQGLTNGQRYGDRVVKEVPVQSFSDIGEAVTRNQKVLVAPELAHDPAFDRVIKIFANPQQQQDLLKFYDKTMQLWKAYATTFGPFSGGFGLRNFLGNQLNGFYLTGTNPIWQGVAAKALHNLKRGISEGDPWKYVTSAEESNLREAFRTGVLGHGFYHEEVSPGHLAEQLRPNAGGSALRKAAHGANPLSLDNYLLRGGRAFNSRIEDISRLGLFIAKRRGGFTADSASSLVQKYLFDYSELSQLDRAAKHVVPFWTWTRKNVPLQLEHLIKTPGAIAFQAHMLEGLRSLTPNYNGAALPFWARQSDAAVLPGGKNAYIPDLPITSANDSIRPALDLIQMLSAKGPKDWQGLGRDTFLAAQPGGPVAGLPGALTQLATGKNVFSGAQTKPGQTIGPLPAGLEQFLESVLPVGPGIAKIRGIANSKTRKARGISGLFGVQTTPLNKKSETNEQWRRYYALLALSEWLRQQGIVIPQGEYTK